ncbi:MarR family winged helix-turn-helix transcriptional regulator [Curtobacterium ammoniigenes]|uniref:MarR family winged helix-turn-helix transcriptional regulator n=1 Tax=Curtobacterium ammoniigenes TaxID=395387 RepID=UPI0014706459|nr:MarR family transcriptional regulator [Curtobacterium ammoniigenes]
MDDATSPEPLASALLGTLTQLIATLRQPRAASGLGAAEIAALMRVKRAGETTAGALARLEGVSAQAMSVTVNGLVVRGLIDRAKDPDDGRRALLRLTDAGQAVLEHRRDQRSAAIVAQLTDQFTPAERALLADATPLLQRLAEAL